MESINTLLIMAIIVVFLGIYLLYLSLKMNKTKKVERLFVTEEDMRRCRDEKGFAEFLSQKMKLFSVGLIAIGIVWLLHETIFNLGWAVYLLVVAAMLLYAWFQNNLIEGRNKFC